MFRTVFGRSLPTFLRGSTVVLGRGRFHRTNPGFRSSGVNFRPMVEKDKPNVRQFLTEHHFTRNQFYRDLGIDLSRDSSYHVSLIFGAIEPNLSVLALDSTKLVGVSLQSLHLRTGSVISPPHQSVLPTAKIKDDYITNIIKRSISHVDVFSAYNIDSYLRMRLGTVHEDYSSRGILKDMVLEVTKLAKEKDIQCVIATATNLKSKRALVTLGFECLTEKPINQLVLQGKPLFGYSDESVSLMAKRL